MAKNLLIIVLALALAASGWLLMQRDSDGVHAVGDAGLPVVADSLEVQLEKMGDELPGVAVGFCLLDQEGKVLSQLNGKTPMIPASTFKTLTTVAALDLMGPEFRFSTKVMSGEVVGGVISGDLVIRGGGDPMLAMADLEEWVVMLKADGLIRIDGSVVGDGSTFPQSMAGDFWGWGDVGNGYGSPTSGLNLEHNRFVAVFGPGHTIGKSATFLRARPEVPGVEWLNEVTTNAAGSGDGVMIYGGPLATSIHLTGTVPMGDDFGVRGAVPNPPLFAAFHLDRILKERGVVIGKPPRALGMGEQIQGERVWVEHASPNVAEILPGLHGRSDNHETECLFQMLGVKAGRPAAEVLTDYWRERGVEPLRVVDGSGLSRADFISAEGLARVQWTAGCAKTAETYRASLSSSHDGKARWKIGGMSSVRSWTGYIEGRHGGELSFALMFNHYRDGSRLDHWRDEILEVVVDGGWRIGEGDP